MTKTTTYQTIYISPSLKVAARPALGRWVVRWSWAGRVDRYAAWLPGQGWNPREWTPTMTVVSLEAIDAVESWLQDRPVPRPTPTLKERALALLDSKDFDTDFTAEQVKLLRQAVESVPETTP